MSTNMKSLLFATSDHWAGLIARVTVAIVIFPHGMQKLLGSFGGYGFSGTMQFFTDTMGLPWFIGFLVIFIEFFGSLLLLIGLAGRGVAVAMAILMLSIIVTSHSQYFFMNWFGNQSGEGFEFFLLVIGLSLIVIAAGSGRYSVDCVIARTECASLR